MTLCSMYILDSIIQIFYRLEHLNWQSKYQYYESGKNCRLQRILTYLKPKFSNNFTIMLSIIIVNLTNITDDDTWLLFKN